MFDQKKYIKGYIKDNYKSIKIRIRKDDKSILKKLDSVENVNQYITDLIRQDIFTNRKRNYIDDNVKIDFPVSKRIQTLMNNAEKADYDKNYAWYLNIVDMIDVLAKSEVKRNNMTEGQWNKLMRRFLL